MLGVGALVFDEPNRILMVERGREPLKGWWALPGGVLEVGETLVEGVRREVLEETGLVVDPVQMVEVFERIIHDEAGRPEYLNVLADYIAGVTGGTGGAADDCAAVQWLERDALASMRLTDGTLSVIDKAYELIA